MPHASHTCALASIGMDFSTLCSPIARARPTSACVVWMRHTVPAMAGSTAPALPHPGACLSTALPPGGSLSPSALPVHVAGGGGARASAWRACMRRDGRDPAMSLAQQVHSALSSAHTPLTGMGVSSGSGPRISTRLRTSSSQSIDLKGGPEGSGGHSRGSACSASGVCVVGPLRAPPQREARRALSLERPASRA